MGSKNIEALETMIILFHRVRSARPRSMPVMSIKSHKLLHLQDGGRRASFPRFWRV